MNRSAPAARMLPDEASGQRDGYFGLALLVMLVLRWVMLTLLIAGVPRLPLRRDWFAYPGADQEFIFFPAYWLSRGRAWRTVAGLGQILVMLFFWKAQEWPLWANHIRPWTGRYIRLVSYVDILPELVFLNAFVLGGLAIVLVGLIGRALTGRKSIGLAAAGWWLVYPYQIALVRCLHIDPTRYRADIVPTLLWMNGLSDAPSFFLVLLATWLAWHSIKSRRAWSLAALGATLAAAVTFRVAVLPAAVCLWAVVAWRLGWRAAWMVALAGLLAYVPQAAYNVAAYDFPLTSGYFYVGAALGQPRTLRTEPLSTFVPFDLRYLAGTYPQLVAQCPMLSPALLVIGLAAGVGLAVVWRGRNWESAALLAAPLPYAALMATFVAFRQDPVRFTMMAHPYLMIAILAAAWEGARRCAGWQATRGSPPWLHWPGRARQGVSESTDTSNEDRAGQ